MYVYIREKNEYDKFDSLNISMVQGDVYCNNVYKFIIELLAKELDIKKEQINYDDGHFWIDIKLKKYKKWYDIFFQSELYDIVYNWDWKLTELYDECKDYYDNGCCDTVEDYFDYEYVKRNW